MKLSGKNTVLASFRLFSLFFGAGNLIFPPFLGQNAGSLTGPALVGFLITAVVLPVLAVLVVARFDGLDKLGSQVGKTFGLVFALLIYLALGPGLAIPRAASVPFEMAVAPYLGEEASLDKLRVIYSLVFFLTALWLCLSPGKLIHRIGYFLTPSLLILLTFLFVSFLARGVVAVAPAQAAYAGGAFAKGFVEGYQTMDALAGLNFGLVILSTLSAFGQTGKREQLSGTLRCGIIAGLLLAGIYAMLSYMGMCSSGVYSIQDNGAWTLRCIVYQLFGEPGAILMAAIFTLACLTTCVGLIHSISQYFNRLWTGIAYRSWVYLITVFSFLVCNLGLDTILSISVPVLSILYPVAIVLILLGLSHGLWQGRWLVYPLTVGATAGVSLICGLGLGDSLLGWLPLYDQGFGWVTVAGVCLGISALEGKKRVA